MADTFRIKRRLAGGAAGPPASLAAAELAFNEQDNTLYYGKGNNAGLATSIVAVSGTGAFLPLTGGTLTGTLTVTNNSNVSASNNVTATNAMFADHMFGFRAGTYGGTVGSWETGTGKTGGFRFNQTNGNLEFGAVDAVTGNLTTAPLALNTASGSIVTTGTILASNTGTAAMLNLTCTSSNGVQIALTGNGATTPNKTIRVVNGQFGIINNAYSAEILSLTDAGTLSVTGNITTPALMYADHIFAYRAGTYGGAVGSWETSTGKTAGFRYNQVGNFIDFGAIDAASGSHTTAPMFFEPNTGAAYKPGGGSWTATSDARIKMVQREYKHGLAEIAKLNPVVYSYVGNDAFTKDGISPHATAAERGDLFVGLVAQEAEAVMPELVSRVPGVINGKAVDDLRALDASAVTWALVNAVKELASRVAALEGKP